MRWPTLIALAIALGLCGLTGSAQADPAGPATYPSASRSSDLSGGSAFPEDDWFETTGNSALRNFNSTATPATLDPPELRAEGATPIAPLPPAVFMGPLGVGLIALASYRLRKKGL